MALIQCTKKLLKELPVDTEAAQDKPSLLGNWHANLLLIERRKCVLFTNDTTLYSLFVPRLTKPDFQKLASIFISNLAANFTYEGLDKYVNAIIEECQYNLSFSRSSNRSVLGSMNDIVNMINAYLYQHGGLENVNCPELNHELNRIPLKAIKYNDAIECLQRQLGNK